MSKLCGQQVWTQLLHKRKLGPEIRDESRKYFHFLKMILYLFVLKLKQYSLPVGCKLFVNNVINEICSLKDLLSEWGWGSEFSPGSRRYALLEEEEIYGFVTFLLMFKP